MRCTTLAMIFLLAGGAAGADPVKGLWLTEPDSKGQVAHVAVKQCGAAALCGTIVRAFDSKGSEIMTPSVGKRVFWDMKPEGQGAYAGRAYVPAHDRNYDAGLRLGEDRLRVEGCLGPVCMGQVWRLVN